jgi:hypothetical protein
MSIVPSMSDNEQKISNSITRFIHDFKVGSLLKKCGCKKEKGIAFMKLFTYILCNVFRDRSMYMQRKTGSFKEDFSKNAYYRFLRNAHSNWLRFTTLLSERIINEHLRKLTSEDRVDCFVVDDSLYERIGYKKTELASKVFDHVSMKFKKGFRMMTVGWTDGCSFIPINFSLLASSKDENILGKTGTYDKRSLAGKRRVMAQTKGTDVMIQLIDEAMKAGHKTKYVLFDSWFSNPHQIVQLKNKGLDIIAMVKISSRISYEYNGQRKNIKQIYNSCKKRRGRSRYLLSVNVTVGQEKKDGRSIDAKIVCVRNRANRKDWLALICTDTSLSEEEIIRIYGKRWDIEVFFKTCKSFLNLGSEYHGLSYDALTAHVALVLTRYMLMSVAKRNDEDERTLGELFYFMVDEVADITFNQSMKILMDAMLESIKAIFQATEEQLTAFTNNFINRLPDYMRKSLLAANDA